MSARLDQALQRFAAHLGADGSVGGALCATCVDVLELPGAGIMLRAGDGAQGSWSVSAGTMSTLEELEHTLGEGPCVDAFTLGVPVVEPDLAHPADPRWVGFTAAAIVAGAAAAFGFPLAIGDVRIGSLNLYSDRPGALSEDQHADALVLADVATHVVLAAQANAPTDTLATELEDIGVHQLRVHQATGMVSAQLSVGVGDALAVLRARAYSSGRPISAVATEVIERRLRFAP